MMKGFYFVRHGETVANASGLRAGGDCDAKLTELGRRQSTEAARKFANVEGPEPGAILTSRMARTLHTSRIIADRRKLRIRIVRDFSERSLGDWNFQTVRSTEPHIVMGFPPRGGESEWRFRKRVARVFQAQFQAFTEWPIIVSSRGVGRQLFGFVDALPNGGVANGKVYRFTLEPDLPFRISQIEEVNVAGARTLWCPQLNDVPVLSICNDGKAGQAGQ